MESLRGKRVAVIGTGASAGQAIPELAKVAKQVVVLQRSPAYVLPRDDPGTPDALRGKMREDPASVLAERQAAGAEMDQTW